MAGTIRGRYESGLMGWGQPGSIQEFSLSLPIRMKLFFINRRLRWGALLARELLAP